MWNEASQTMPVEALRELQLERLQRQIKLFADRIPFYAERLSEAGFSGTISSLSDTASLPFTSKYDMREGYPFGLFAAPMEEVVEFHMSSGTTGKPVVAGYTRQDQQMWGDVMARTYDAAGVTAGDIVHNCFGYGLFTGGFGYHYGAHTLGAAVIPMSSGNTARQLSVMADFGSSVITCTPSYAQYVAEYAIEHDLKHCLSSLRVGLFGAEPWSEAMREDLQTKMGLEAYDTYGLTELIGPGVGVECPEHDGMHIMEDHFYPEIIDPGTEQPLPDGEVGELVLTTLTREGTPVLRYRTRDITTLMPEPCRCGRTSRRIARLSGRTDDMLIIRGVNVFPSQIEEVLVANDDVQPQYQIIVDRHGSMDSLDVEVEMHPRLLEAGPQAVDHLQIKLEEDLHSVLTVQAKVHVLEPHTLERSTGKARRVVDRRS